MTDAAKSTPAVLSTVDLLRHYGFRSLPIAAGTKLTYCKNFTAPSFLPPYDDWQNQDLGVGIVLGGTDKLVDIDLDDPRIGRLAVAHLPHTTWIFGRKSKKASHHVFVIEDDAGKQQQQRESDPRNKGLLDTESNANLGKGSQDKLMIVEYRGDKAQTVMPGTLHEGSGELIEWENGTPTVPPGKAKAVELRRSVRKIALTVVVSDWIWESGIRHEVTLCLAGMMFSAKWKQSEAEHFFNNLIDFSSKGERRNVLTAVRDTYKNAKENARIAGAPRLIELTGRGDVVAFFRSRFCDPREAAFEDFNARFAAAVYFSKLCILDFRVVDDVTKPDFEVMSLPDFQNLYCNDRIQVPGPKGMQWVSKADSWFKSPKRRTYPTTDFLPGQPSEVGLTLNLWRGWGVKPDPHQSIDCWLDHVWRFICSEDEKLHHWLMAWMADIVQNPMSKPGTAVVMRSRTRTGKNTFVEMLQRMIGIRHYREMNNAGQITNRFNSHLQYAMLVFANEAEFVGKINAHPTLKTLITDENFHMDHKHGHAKTGKNYSRVMLASNRLHVLDRESDDQRFTVVEVKNPHDHLDDPQAHFSGIWQEINNGGPAGLLAHLQSYKYDRDHLRCCYQSEAGRQQIIMSMDCVAQWWASVLSEGAIRVSDAYLDSVQYVNGTPGWPKWISKAALEDAFRQSYRWADNVPSALFFAQLYEASGMSQANTVRTKKSGRRIWTLHLPPLEDCAERMNERFMGAVDVGDGPIAPELMVEPGDEHLAEEF